MKRSPYLANFLAGSGTLVLGVAGLLSTLNAEALTLGRLKVLSALGQPLIAEIDVPDITPEESGSLRVGIAAADAFKSAGLEYNPVVTSLTIAGKRRADGRALLELRSTQAVNEPFLDLVLEITWATGRMVRDYTLLLDPQTGQPMPALVPTPTLPIQTAVVPQVTTAPSTGAAPIGISSTTSSLGGATSFSTRTGDASRNTGSSFSARTDTKVTAAPKSVATKLSVKTKAISTNGSKQVVQRGDTAAAIAAANKPEGVSLDQMLVALLRANPDAFVEGNVNRLKTGALLAIPSEQDAAAIAKGEAKNNIQVQARDFNDYRRKLAGLATGVASNSPARQATGKVTAKVDDSKPAATALDRLTLAKPTPANSATTNVSPEDKVAKDRAASDATVRSAELQKNISDLGKIAAGSSPAPASPAAASPTPASLASSSSNESLVVPSTVSAPVLAVASSPVQSASKAVPPVAAVQAPTTSNLDRIITHPLALPVGGGLLTLLGLGALWRMRQRRKDADRMGPQSSMNFPVTRQPSDTVFGALGANHVDTQESAASSTMVYSPSQLGSAAGDVDPIAEADVYLAYNRDVQAEEILKEAKRAAPDRSDLQIKLMEIYTKRRDNEAFDAAALELHRLTDGAGSDWAKARELAQEINSTHVLFNASTSTFAPSEMQFQPVKTAPLAAVPNTGLIDFDLSALTLDLPQSSHLNLPPEPFAAVATSEDPKLALAEEYLSIGDKAGARALIQDVMTHGSPSAQAAAQLMLGRIG